MIAGNFYSIVTGGNGLYDRFWAAIDKTSYVFEVKACSYVHIALSATPGNTTNFVYLIVIGLDYNANSMITVVGDEVLESQTVYTPSIVSCTQFLPFWVSWNNGKIEVGKGEVVGDYAFMSVNASLKINVTSMAMTTSEKSSGIFYFPQNSGNKQLLIKKKVII